MTFRRAACSGFMSHQSGGKITHLWGGRVFHHLWRQTIVVAGYRRVK
jgi:hypothetical protein